MKAGAIFGLRNDLEGLAIGQFDVKLDKLKEGDARVFPKSASRRQAFGEGHLKSLPSDDDLTVEH